MNSQKRCIELLNKDLRNTNLRNADLRKASLQSANLQGADLTKADLRNVNLLVANLAGANLAGANLAGASLIDVDLTGANLAGANLSGADLRNANLTGANLTCTKLIDADLSGICLKRSRFNRVIGVGTKAGEISFAKTLGNEIEQNPNYIDMESWCECLAGHACPGLSNPGREASTKYPTLAQYFLVDYYQALAALERVASGKESVFS
jgi:hypothetical protein